MQLKQGEKWTVETGHGSVGQCVRFRLWVDRGAGSGETTLTLTEAEAFLRDLTKAVTVQRLRNEQRDAERAAVENVRADYEARIKAVDP